MNSFDEFLNICKCNPTSLLVEGLQTEQEKLVFIQRAKEVLGNALQGDPLTYYEGKRDGIVSVQTWKDFIASLKSEFSPGGKRPLQWKHEWDELVPNHFPSFLAFAEQVKKVAQYAGETEAAQIDKVKRYAPYDIYPMIAEPATLTFSQLMDRLKEIDARRVYAPPVQPQAPPANPMPFMHIQDSGELKADMKALQDQVCAIADVLDKTTKALATQVDKKPSPRERTPERREERYRSSSRDRNRDGRRYPSPRNRSWSRDRNRDRFRNKSRDGYRPRSRDCNYRSQDQSWSRDRRPWRSSSPNQGCWDCGQTDHFRARCPFQKGADIMANKLQNQQFNRNGPGKGKPRPGTFPKRPNSPSTPSKPKERLYHLEDEVMEWLEDPSDAMLYQRYGDVLNSC